LVAARRHTQGVVGVEAAGGGHRAVVVEGRRLQIAWAISGISEIRVSGADRATEAAGVGPVSRSVSVGDALSYR
jgi:hypothetical protein